MKIVRTFVILTLALSLVVPATAIANVPAQPASLQQAAPNDVVTFTILHTNDFHGRLQPDSSNRGGSAHMAGKLNEIRTDVGEENVVLLDAGDVYFAAPAISQLLLGESAIDIYNMLGYDAAVYGNHEFDKGQTVMVSRTLQSNFPWLGANVIITGTEWTNPDWALPYITMTVGITNQIVLGVLGLAGEETPEVTLVGTTDGVYFKDLTQTILYYYDEIMAAADSLIVVAHMGTEDSGVYKGLATVAQELIDAGKPVDLMIAGHQHQALFTPVEVGDTKIIGAGYYGRWLGRADVSVDTDTKKLDVLNYELITINTTVPADTVVADRVQYWADIVAPLVNQPVGFTNIDLLRDYNAESLMGDIVTDSMLWKADMYDDGVLNGSVVAAFTNPGGLRADITIPGGATLPYTVTWGATFDVLPFGNTLVLMDLTGAQVQDILDQSGKLYKGILQSAGAEYFFYNDTGTGTPNAWGAYGIKIGGEPLVRNQVYRVVTNNFLAGGGDDWTTFAQGANVWDTYYDMQAAFVEYIEMLGTIDTEDIEIGRITQLDEVVTILHTNDVHGNVPAGMSSGNKNGMEYLASLIKAERAHNPDVLLLDAGDTFQGNSFAYFFKDRPDNPIAGSMNLLGYDAMVIGNHEYNFGPTTFATMLGQVTFPLLGKANVDDDGSYGFINDNVQVYITTTVGSVDLAIFGLTNPRVYRYELPTNIPGLTFHPVLTITEQLVSDIHATEAPDLLIGLTHIGYAPYGDEVDSDVLIAENIAGIDLLVGGHSHTKLDPAVLVTSTVNLEGTLIAQSQRYALYLGKVNVGFIGGDIVLREGYLIPANEAEVDPDLNAYLVPYLAEITAFNETEIGQTVVPIDALQAYTQETNAANLQADAAVWALTENEVEVDFHLSGAMANRRVADTATFTTPFTLTVADMFSLMPYENSLVVIEMNGPQIKRVLERAYRNYYYYKYVPDRGGYSYYTTCMLAINSLDNQITYRDSSPYLPDGYNVVSLKIGDQYVDFNDEDTYYRVSTVNYLAAGSCNFNDAGETIWPLDQIVEDTQYYVRDVVIDYIAAQLEPIAPAIEGRLDFIRMIFMPFVQKIFETLAP